MGLIRKSLCVATIGGVNGSSKKQRVAKAQLDAQRELVQLIRNATNQPAPPTRLQRVTAEALHGATERAKWKAELEHPDTPEVRRCQLRSFLLT